MKILFLAHRVPYAPNRGDRIRAYQVLRHLKALGHSVHLIAFAHDAEEATHGAALAELVDGYDIVRLPRLFNHLRAVAALLGTTPLTHVLLHSPRIRTRIEAAVGRARPDVVYAFCSGMARFALEPPLEDVPLVLDLVDVDSLKWQSLADISLPPLRWVYLREAPRLAAFEARAARIARRTLVVTAREAASLATLAPDVAVDVVPVGVDVASFRPPADLEPRSPEVIFAGVFGYRPNFEAAEWLIERCWPVVRDACPRARLLLVGADPPGRLLAAARRSERVVVTGRVPRVEPYLWRASVAAAPLHTARGTQTKVLEALGAGLPVVVTPVVADGLPPGSREGCIVAESPDAFGAALVRLLRLSDADRARLLAAVSVDRLDWGHALASLDDILHSAADPAPPANLDAHSKGVPL